VSVDSAYHTTIGVHLIALSHGKVLLGRRANTGFADGLWSTPGGRLEAGELVERAVIREAAEEVDIAIRPEDLSLAHLCHHLDPDGRARLGVFFATTTWSGSPVNAEPGRCTEIAWHRVEELPEDMVDYVRAAIIGYHNGHLTTMHGW
jgi:8-oxo-dGTP diphosphatase